MRRAREMPRLWLKRFVLNRHPHKQSRPLVVISQGRQRYEDVRALERLRSEQVPGDEERAAHTMMLLGHRAGDQEASLGI
jgi:hypothetical protein